MARLDGGHIRTGLFLGSWLYWTANAALTVLLVAFTVERFDASGQAVGPLITGLGAGYLCGSAISGMLLRRWSARTLLTMSYALVGACFLVMFTSTGLPVVIVAATAAGLPGAVAGVATAHHVQAGTPGPALGRSGSK